MESVEVNVKSGGDSSAHILIFSMILSTWVRHHGFDASESTSQLGSQTALRHPRNLTSTAVQQQVTKGPIYFPTLLLSVMRKKRERLPLDHI